MAQPSPFEIALGQEVRSWRQRRGLTLFQLAERSGVSKATIERFENATHATSIANTWKLADALDVPFSKLVKRAEEALLIDQPPLPGEGNPPISDDDLALRRRRHEKPPMYAFDEEDEAARDEDNEKPKLGDDG